MLSTVRSVRKLMGRNSRSARVVATAAFLSSALIACGGEVDSSGSGGTGEEAVRECVALIRPTGGSGASDAFSELGSAMDSDLELQSALMGFLLAPGAEANSVAVWVGGSPTVQLQEPTRPAPDQVASARSALEEWVGTAGGRFALELDPPGQACGT
jgi:hypothetical protein